MNREEAKTEYIHLTLTQVNHVLDGMNLLMQNHYEDYDDHLPEHIIEIVNVFTEVRSKFKYCASCRNNYYQRWSSSDCGCPESQEEEE
tara:strand:+ start:66 stop:329 length:264 start_codon:yes stop_codon:yes gene_type:complete